MRKILILLLLLSACQERSIEIEDINIVEDEVKFNGITIIPIDNNVPVSIFRRSLNFYERLDGIYAFDTLSKNDTISIAFNDPIELVSITHSDSFLWKDYVVTSGDTVYLSYQDEKLSFTKKKTGEVKFTEWSYDILFQNNSQRLKLDSLKSIFVKTKELGGRKFIMPNVETKDDWEKSLSFYVSSTEEFYNKIADSLEQKSDAKSTLYIALTKKKKFNELDQVIAIVKDEKFKQNLYNEYLTAENFQNRYLSNVFGQYFFRNFARQNNIRLQDAYDNSFQDFDPIINRFFKSRTIQEMVGKKYQRNVVLSYLDKYKAEFGDLSPIEDLALEMEYGFTGISDMDLQSLDGESILWEDLKTKWKGKVIYLDFWASWCAPCLRAMPYSHELKKKFNREEVVFVYLAINDKKNPWLEKSNRFDINENNFLIKNSKTSDFIKKTKITTIPRYMIFDKEGNLVHEDAPGPDKPESYEILNQILGK